ncbi:MAG: FixH family protein [Cyclobacteriaceae bacterium]|nr:FixH family protein [Cyclobacteriaceae bacterium]
MSWPRWIFVSFLLFMVFIGTMVVIMMKQDISLVADDYYEQELIYQQQLERKNNALKLDEKPKVKISEGKYAEVSFPYDTPVQGGRIQVFRPSSKKLDEQFVFETLADNRLRFEMKEKASGAYRIRIWWKMHDKEYYWEEFLVI